MKKQTRKKYTTNLLLGSMLLVSLSISGCQKAASTASRSESQIDSNNTVTEYDTETVSQSQTLATEPETAAPDINDYVRVLDYIPDIVVDLKYATADNFTKQIIYDFDEAYLRYGTVKKLRDAQNQFKELGYRIKIWDAYRPFTAQQRMWKVYPDPNYVANPAKGMAGHNLGNTMDITLVNLDGSEVLMPTEFDNFTKRADRNYSEIDEPAASHALLLQNIMYQNDFKGYQGEWWDFTDHTTYSEIDDFQP